MSRTNAYAAQGREWLPLGTFEGLERELNEAKQQAIDFLKAWVESDADRLRLRAVLQSIDLSPCNGGSCQVATDADDYIQAALVTTSAPPPVVAKADADALAEELYESMALNINVFSDADTETCSYYSEHKKVIKDAKAALETYRAKYPKP
jgi:hypothetical protein